MAEAAVTVDGGSSPAMVAAARAVARATELSARRPRRTDRGVPQRDPGQARQRLELAVAAAVEAAERAAQARERAALAHDGAAALHEQMAARGIGHTSWHEQQSRRHRAAAQADRLRGRDTLPETPQRRSAG
jgi:hypothetical protein